MWYRFNLEIEKITTEINAGSSLRGESSEAIICNAHPEITVPRLRVKTGQVFCHAKQLKKDENNLAAYIVLIPGEGENFIQCDNNLDPPATDVAILYHLPKEQFDLLRTQINNGQFPTSLEIRLGDISFATDLWDNQTHPRVPVEGIQFTYTTHPKTKRPTFFQRVEEEYEELHWIQKTLFVVIIIYALWLILR